MTGCTGTRLSALVRTLPARARRLLLRVEVQGPSMIPALAPGDRLIVVRSRRCRPGDIVAVADPGGEHGSEAGGEGGAGRMLVKRVVSVGTGGIVLAGDNEGASRDSRDFGPVVRSRLVGRAVYRYHPAGSVGPLRRRRRPEGRGRGGAGGAGERGARGA